MEAVSIPDEVTEISIDFIFQPHYGPGVVSTVNRNEYEDISWR
jgi:hypothetical protein